MIVLVTGVSGSGKTTVGQAAAARLAWRFADADDFHTAGARARMARGQPLDDTDREPWLARLAAAIRDAVRGGAPLVLACSALKAAYRARLTAAADGQPVLIVFLEIDPLIVRRRLETRPGHFAGPSLVPSQFATLEPPTDALVLDATQPVDVLAAAIAAAAREGDDGSPRRAASH